MKIPVKQLCIKQKKKKLWKLRKKTQINIKNLLVQWRLFLEDVQGLLLFLSFVVIVVIVFVVDGGGSVSAAFDNVGVSLLFFENNDSLKSG